MATNRELTTEAEALGEELGVSVETRGLNNAKLHELVERLRGMKAERPPALLDDSSFETSAESESSEGPPEEELEESDTIPPGADAEDLEDAPEVEVETVVEHQARPPVHVVDGAGETPTGGVRRNRGLYRYPYTVAEGCMIHSRRGRLAAFAAIRETDLSGGLAELEQLVKSGHVVKRR